LAKHTKRADSGRAYRGSHTRGAGEAPSEGFDYEDQSYGSDSPIFDDSYDEDQTLIDGQYTAEAPYEGEFAGDYAGEPLPVDERLAASDLPSTADIPQVPEVDRVAPQAAAAPVADAGAPRFSPSATAQLESLPSIDPVTQPQVASGPPVISFRNLTKIYPAQPNRPALDNISLDIYPSEFVFLVGHSGSGKSTFIRLLNRELVPTRGRLIVAGENLSSIRAWRVPYLRRNIGCVYQDFKLLPNKTTFENVAFALEVIGKSKHVIRTQVPEVLRLVGLEDKMNKMPDQLSGGEQQRVSIARAMVNRPPLLICDEPTGNLDPQTSLGIMRLLERINRTGTTVVVATHDREMVDSMRRRVVALENGRLVRDEDQGVYSANA
jgi:cell division transport system ATP-binding protein